MIGADLFADVLMAEMIALIVLRIFFLVPKLCAWAQTP